ETLSTRLAARQNPTVGEALEAASDEYDQAIALNADRPEAHLRLARRYFAKNDAEDGREQLALALALDPAFVPAAINLADFYRARGQIERAEPVLRQTLRRAPDS